MVDGRPDDIVERGGARDLAAEFVEVRGALRDMALDGDLRTQPRREIAGEHGDRQEQQQRQDDAAIGDMEAEVGLW